MKKLVSAGITIVCLLSILSGCKDGLFHHRLKEGSIQYKIAVLDTANPMSKMAPDEMTIKFKDNRSRAELMAGMGMFQMSFINDEPGKKIMELVREVGKKMACVSDTAAINKDLAHDIQFKITETSDTLTIAGYKCHKALAKSVDGKAPDCELYYTDDIKLDDPNWATPFKAVKGVLMKYRISKYGVYMEFTAEKVEADKIDDDIFKLPADYKIVAKEQIDELF